ncbi:3-hydroxyacyl-CoA dehydrogenase family protein [Neobacillus niacini]|uniref:3-hydroxyacyl-CoA dehydrogenase family protein n=1 Tax=Neobacillus niacini TaxID=86668 RepID=UPI0007AB8DCE|nr:3-hydroxyacyl-CoA dehydrogenase family protein [Neobacillus niacini]MEC1523224.1 3-hydroxyacyl-CoA dehydrogenase family protein [Neobacillus niacini]
MKIKTVGVVGAGTMGSGISNAIASCGYKVLLYDIGEKQLQRGLLQIEKFMDKGIQRGKISEKQKVDSLENIYITTNFEDLKEADFVIEAVVEDIKVKKNVFSRLDDLLHEEAIIATNTSSMSITEIAEATKRQDRVVGMHFFNPAQIMKLVEVVRGFKTSDETVEAVRDFSVQLNKEPIVVNKDIPGFIVNRILIPQFIEAIKLLEEGVASAEDIDKAVMLGLNYPMGPFALQDYGGVDISYYVMNYFKEEFNDNRFAPPLLLKQLMRAGRLGTKVGAGFYDYNNQRDDIKI